jgi:1,5-anhydro-D-fructose reductase (1,5-anhydro-D-mannitol-forming)
MNHVRWGIIGCGDVTEVKSGPAFQKAEGSSLVAVMRRDAVKAADYARRHGVPRWYDRAGALVDDPEVDAVYVATPPASHLDMALLAAAAGKPCLVEKPMSRNHDECVRMIDAFESRGVPLFVAYYRRALPRFVEARRLLREGAVGTPTSVHVFQYAPLLTGADARVWRVDPAIAGGGLFLDLGSHAVDLLDFLLGPIAEASGIATNTGGTYAAEDLVAACFRFESGAVGTGVWNFNADRSGDGLVVGGSGGELYTPVFTDGPLVVRAGGTEEVRLFERPPHVHQPFVQTVVDALLGRETCESPGASGARASWAMDRCLAGYRATSSPPSSTR